MKKIAIIFLLVFFAAQVSYATSISELTIPNSFTAGTAAKASEVNADFTAVKTTVNELVSQVNTNTANAGYVVKVGTTTIGRFLGFGKASDTIKYLQVITSQKYIGNIYFNPSTDFNRYKMQTGVIYYTDNACTSQAYTEMPAFERYVFRDMPISTGAIWYVSGTPTAVTAGTAYQKNSAGTCAAASTFSAGSFYSPLTQDTDGSTTGFPSNGLYTGTVTIETASQ